MAEATSSLQGDILAQMFSAGDLPETAADMRGLIDQFGNLSAADLVEALARAGVEHEHVVYDGMPHGFAQMEFFPQARQSIDRMVEFLGKHLGS